MTFPHFSQFFINGAWVAPIGTEVIDFMNPATEAVLAKLPMGNADDIDAAVAAAKAARSGFAAWTVQDRIALLEKILSIYTRRVDEFATAIMTEMGSPIDFARNAQAQVGIDHLEALIKDLTDFSFEETLRNGDLALREPVGVCGLITPWNWPINQIVLKVGPALAAGCTMVLKPSELTPLSANLLAEVLEEAGVPAGVFNLVHGEGTVVGAALSKHPDVAMMSFTGSTRAGTAIVKDSADTVTRVALELGGKSPNLVFADCDLERAIDEGIDACFINTGQSCDAATRMLVERSVYGRAIELARVKCSGVQVGDPTAHGDHLGPLVSSDHFGRVQALIKVGIDEGATVLCGGLGRPDNVTSGYFAKPTIFIDVHNKMDIAQQEVFGPVLVIIPFETEADAIEIANDTAYGLGAYIQTSDPVRATRVARVLEAGTVNINGGYLGSGSPFGGVKMSGFGREGGAEGIEEFLQTKLIAGAG